MAKVWHVSAEASTLQRLPSLLPFAGADAEWLHLLSTLGNGTVGLQRLTECSGVAAGSNSTFSRVFARNGRFRLPSAATGDCREWSSKSFVVGRDLQKSMLLVEAAVVYSGDCGMVAVHLANLSVVGVYGSLCGHGVHRIVSAGPRHSCLCVILFVYMTLADGKFQATEASGAFVMVPGNFH